MDAPDGVTSGAELKADSARLAKVCTNDVLAACGCTPFGGICPVLASPEVAELALVLAPTTGRTAAIRYAKQVIDAGYRRVIRPGGES